MAHYPSKSALPPTNESEAFWATAVSSLEKNDNELLIPNEVAHKLGAFGLDYLKQRLSHHLAIGSEPVQVIGFHDDLLGCYRIMRTPGFLGTSRGATSHTIKDKPSGHKLRAASKKFKIPRPPNAFILFRAYRHPELKRENPQLTNNDISIILGKEWRSASEKVKTHFRTLAEIQKAEHAAKYPEYQYTPRKPSDKKHRKTTKKTSNVIESEEGPSHMSSTTANAPAVTELDDGGFMTTLPFDADQLDDEMRQHFEAVMWDMKDPIASKSGTSVILSTAQQVQEVEDYFTSLIDWTAVQNDLTALHQNNGDHTLADALGNVVINGGEDPTPFEEQISELAQFQFEN